jgi:uncharacterized protein YcbK (DUF882 family)
MAFTLPTWLPFVGTSASPTYTMPNAATTPTLPMPSVMGQGVNDVTLLIHNIQQTIAPMSQWVQQNMQQQLLNENAQLQQLQQGFMGQAIFPASASDSSSIFSGLFDNEQKHAGSYTEKASRYSPTTNTFNSTTSTASISSVDNQASNRSSTGTGLSDSQSKAIYGKTDASGSPELASLGVGDHKLHPEAAKQFTQANENFKRSYRYDIPVISSYRSPEHNAKIGGSPTSNHTKGVSIDLDANALNAKGHYMAAIKVLRAAGFEPLDGVTYVKKGVAQDEYNHLDFVGVGNTSNDWNGPKVA